MAFFKKITSFILDKIQSTCKDENEIDSQVSDCWEPLEQQPREPAKDARDVNDHRSNGRQNDQQNQLSRNPSPFYNVVQIFTDGSMLPDGKSGSCFVLHNLTTGHIIYKTYRLANQISCCVAEYAAIYQALNFLISNEVDRSHIELYTDVELAPFYLSDTCNQLVVGKKKSRINLTIFKQMIHVLRSRQNVIEFRWIRRCSVLLCKYADLFAKQGSRLKEVNFDASVIQV